MLQCAVYENIKFLLSINIQSETSQNTPYAPFLFMISSWASSLLFS